jgi:hypothetical protein
LQRERIAVKVCYVQRAESERKDCDIIDIGLPRVQINEQGEIISKWKDKKVQFWKESRKTKNKEEKLNLKKNIKMSSVTSPKNVKGNV